jgi:mono/diheme cytochrome c family protein
MSPFSLGNGGPLDDDEINAIISFMRSWEENPPVDVPPEVIQPTAVVTETQVPPAGDKIYGALCASCHGSAGEGGTAAALITGDVQQDTDQEIFDAINKGMPGTAMAAWGEVLNPDQIDKLVQFIRTFTGGETSTGTATPTPSAAYVFADISPILTSNCAVCHGSMGGWDASSYESVMESGAHAPVVVPGDAANSLLAQKILGTHKEGAIMPPSGKMSDGEIQIIIDWINAGAIEK